jgi:BON domain
MRRPTLAALALAALACLAGRPARADVKPHALFTDGMVLQHQPDPLPGVPVWGTAEPGEKVRVALEQVVILRGKVGSDYERRQAQLLIQFTPGVKFVQNELEIP